jgi:hypothetical protein
MTLDGAQLPTSYFSTPSQTLDPTLFDGRTLKPWVRQGVLNILYDFLGKTYRHPELWAHAWIAGSGVSYQWEASRQPADLDCLIGVDYLQFRKANPEFVGLSDTEISYEMNDQFREQLHPQTENWNGFELTFYVNPGATDIRSIKPYAAYDLKYDEWTVSPDPSATPPQNLDWEQTVLYDKSMATQSHTRYNAALQDLQTAQNAPSRRNAETRLMTALGQANALFDEIHLGRKQAFDSSGEGYSDFHNYRWQAGKREGTIDTLRAMRQHYKTIQQSLETSLYGAELPSSDTLLRRAALYRAK